MGKLGKKARKFAKKHLQSVLKNRRKFKSMRDSFRRKSASRKEGEADEDRLRVAKEQSNVGISGGMLADGAVGDASLDNLLFSDSDGDSIEDASDSDGYLSEDSNCPQTADVEREDYSGDEHEDGSLSGQNRDIHLAITEQKRKLDKLRKKDPDFTKYLESHRTDLEKLRIEETYSDEEGERNNQGGPTRSDGLNLHEVKVLTSSIVDTWCQLILQQQSVSVLPSLLNAFRAACHYGSDSLDEISSQRIEKRDVFCKILMFVLSEADGIFRRLLGISCTNCKKETILELKNTAKWKTMKPLLKSYLWSTLHLLNQVTDHQILNFTLSRFRTSTIFFVAFPSLRQRVIEVAVHLWATGGGSVSVLSFFIVRDIVQFNSDCIDTCMKKTYKAFIAHCKFVEPTNIKQLQFLRDSVIELYSLDMQKSYNIALSSVKLLAKILQQAFRTKNKEALKRIYNWQYINCIDLWVKYISANIRDHDLQLLLYLVIQLISGVAHLFPGPRYLPLRLKCIQMLNQLSNSSGVFIPIASLALSSLEYRETSKADARLGRDFNFSSLLKVPKQLLKLQDFQEACIRSAIELLSAHFAQWSYHVSLPELATVPLIRLRKFYEKTTAESLQRLVKRLIDQVEQNVEFVERKRDEVTFSPKDQAAVDSFLQLEKNGCDAPFTRYYASIQQNSISRNAVLNEKISELEQNKARKKQGLIHGNLKVIKRNLEDGTDNSMANKSSRQNNKRRKQK